MRDFPPDLAALASRQHGLFTTAQARKAGLSPSTEATLLRRGLLERVDRGLLRHVAVPRTWHTAVMAAVLVAGGPSVASHRCAAALWGVPDIAKGTPEISIRRGRRLRRKGIRVHESSDLDRFRPVTRDGVPTTSLPRTILDLARRTGDERLARIVQWARRERKLTWTQLVEALLAHARPGRPGIRRLRRVIAQHAGRDEISDSDFEELVLALLREFGLPEPVLHHAVRLGGRRYVIDLAYPGLRIAIELDGGIHMDPEVFRNDRRRQNALVLDGWLILRFTWDDFRTAPERIVAEIKGAIAERTVAH